MSRAAVTSAAVVPAGAIPARCVVQGIATPTSDSQIRFEVWLPVSGWNGKYQQVGNGGWAGALPAAAMADPVRRGYAVAGTDDGHQGSGAAWAIGHPEKIIDFGYRAVHVTYEQSRAIVKAFYGADIRRNYFVGCSDGGREALMEAQRYPEDFDGIVAGAPANDWSHLMVGGVWNELALLDTAGSAIPPAKLPAIQRAVLDSCDQLDGVKDGLIEDPRACRFDPAVLLCKGEDSIACLTAPQLAALRKIYAGPKSPRTGEPLAPGFPPGSEAGPNGWVSWVTTADPARAIQFYFSNSYFGQAVHEQAEWDFHKMDFTADVALSDSKVGPFTNAMNPDLRSFRAHGGKLIQYHGWGDAAISPLNSINYYDNVRAFLSQYPDARGEASRPMEDFYRLFLVPGMGHCGGGAGPNRFDAVSALEAWVEKGAAPERLIGEGKDTADASKTLTRPLCPYPQTAHYKGSGDPDSAASFECALPPGRR